MNVDIVRQKPITIPFLKPLCAIVLIVVITDYRSRKYFQRLQSIYIRLELTLKSLLKLYRSNPMKMIC